MPQDRARLVPVLHNIATALRIDSIRATTAAGSGHPTTCASAADLVAALFFAEMRFDPAHPRHVHNDRFVLSKGHAAPLLYAAWSQVGFVKHEELLKLRELDNNLEGHPTPRLEFVDVATGSLGQGLPAGIGSALNARRIKSDYRTYVLMGDGETAEGSVWEAAEAANHFHARQSRWHHRREPSGPEPSDDVAARHGGAGPPLARLRLARHRHRRPQPGRDPRRVRRGAREEGSADDDPGQDVQGLRHQLRAGQGRLARQGAEARGSRSCREGAGGAR